MARTVPAGRQYAVDAFCSAAMRCVMGRDATWFNCVIDCLSMLFVRIVMGAGVCLGVKRSDGCVGFVRKISSLANEPKTWCVAKSSGLAMTALKRSLTSDFWQPVARRGAIVLTAVLRGLPLGMPSFSNCFGFIFFAIFWGLKMFVYVNDCTIKWGWLFGRCRIGRDFRFDKVFDRLL